MSGKPSFGVALSWAPACPRSGTIIGTVTEEESVAPLAGVDVVLEGMDHSGVSWSDGRFILSHFRQPKLLILTTL